MTCGLHVFVDQDTTKVPGVTIKQEGGTAPSASRARELARPVRRSRRPREAASYG